MYKRMVLILFTVLLMVACSDQEDEASTSAEDDQSNETIKLRVSSGLNPQDNNNVGFTVPWTEEVTERTDGKVEFEIFMSGELVPTGEEIRALQDGTIDIAVPVLPTYDPKSFPLSDVTMLPLVESDTIIAAEAHAELINSTEEFADGQTFTEFEYEHYDIKVLPMQPTSEYTIATVDHEFDSVDSFKRISLRAGGRAHEDFIDEIGAGAISMAVTEEFEALSRGALDGTVKAVSDWAPFGHDELLTDALTGINLGHLSLFTAISNDTWDSLPEDVQEIMIEVANDLVTSPHRMELQESATAKAKDEGIKFKDISELDEEAQEMLEQAATNTWQRWIDEKEADGLPGLEIALIWRDLVLKHGGEVPEAVKEFE